MSILRITGGRQLEGAIRIHGAKNSVLPIMAASILARGETIIHNCPKLADVNAAIKILRHLGCTVDRSGSSVVINSAQMTRSDIPHELMKEMRSSVIFLGAILARCGEAALSMPGGCELGPRPVDLHIMALHEMGAQITDEGGSIICKANELLSCKINFSIPSVGATENAMLAATACRGTTTITNAAREPEIGDLQRYLRSIGVKVTGAGTSTIIVEGGKIKANAEHHVIPDRIVAATYLACAAASLGRIELTNVIPGHIATVTDAFSEMGCRLKISDDAIYIDAAGKLRAIKPVITRPYPGFPTDAQPPLMAASLKASGTTVFIESIFENRYRHIGELLRMGADIKTEGKVAMVTGVSRLFGAPVESTDLRGGAALCVAALGAEGVTEVSGLHHIDRGYDGFTESLAAIGADIVRVE
ncbi:MAG: UDP-N-acetylglucosamine 1-carboxyvinyltransferase [Oscillospiraceae bacterium]|nr:UDP-N-acetylglucosamine 1-carboxyvinyltransferase [Oscillospiraceae bacterium]